MAHEFLTLNNWQLPARDGSVSQAIIPVSDNGAAWSNKRFSNRKKYARQWTVSVECRSAEDANSIEAFIEHGGDYFAFNDSLFSASGFGPDQQNLIGTRFVSWGNRHAASFGSGGSLVYDLKLKDDAWTFFFLESTNTSSSSWFYVCRSDGFFWDNGEKDFGHSNDVSIMQIIIDSGAIALTNPSSSDMYVGKLLVFPIPLSDSAISAIIDGYYEGIYAIADFAGPHILLDGAIVNDKPVEVIGEISSQQIVQFGSNEGWVNNGRNVSFTLTETLNPIKRTDLYISDDFAMRFGSTTMPKRPIMSVSLLDGKYLNSAEGRFSEMGVSGTLNTVNVPFLKTSGGGAVTAVWNSGNATILGGNDWAYAPQGATVVSTIVFVKRMLDTDDSETIFAFSEGSSSLYSVYFEQSNLFFMARPQISQSLITVQMGPYHVVDSEKEDWIAIYAEADFLNSSLKLKTVQNLIVSGNRSGELYTDEVLTVTGLWSGDKYQMGANGSFTILSDTAFGYSGSAVAYFGLFQNKRLTIGEVAQCYKAFMSGNFY